MYKTIVVTPAAAEPISTDEANRQLRIEDGDDDDQRDLLIAIARDKAENFCNRFFTVQTVKIVYSGEFGAQIDLPYPDLTSVNSITYIDSENTQQTFTGFSFFSDEQVIYPDDSFPIGVKSYTVEVVTAPPAEFGGAKIGMLMLLTDLYELRSESVVGFSVAKNPAVVNSLYPYRVRIGV